MKGTNLRSEVCPVCGGRKSACDILGHRAPGDNTQWQDDPVSTIMKQGGETLRNIQEKVIAEANQKSRAGEHTPGPWLARDGVVIFPNDEGGFSLQPSPVPFANARRIVACVNYCDGVPIEMLEEYPGDIKTVSGIAIRNGEEADALAEALAGLLSVEDSVTQGQESERRAEWVPKARAILSKRSADLVD